MINTRIGHSWAGKKMGTIADEMQTITSREELEVYRGDVIETADHDAITDHGWTAEEWFMDKVKFVLNRRDLPLVWYDFAGWPAPEEIGAASTESHNATPAQHENATDAEKSNETDS